MLQTRVEKLESERITNITELAAKREESVGKSRENNHLREMLSTITDQLQEERLVIQQMKESLLQLAVEKELRQRCECREESERRERIAACAQVNLSHTCVHISSIDP